jgi:hypothetical protein
MLADDHSWVVAVPRALIGTTSALRRRFSGRFCFSAGCAILFTPTEALAEILALVAFAARFEWNPLDVPTLQGLSIK